LYKGAGRESVGWRKNSLIFNEGLLKKKSMDIKKKLSNLMEE